MLLLVCPLFIFVGLSRRCTNGLAVSSALYPANDLGISSSYIPLLTRPLTRNVLDSLNGRTNPLAVKVLKRTQSRTRVDQPNQTTGCIRQEDEAHRFLNVPFRRSGSFREHPEPNEQKSGPIVWRHLHFPLFPLHPPGSRTVIHSNRTDIARPVLTGTVLRGLVGFNSWRGKRNKPGRPLNVSCPGMRKR